MPVKSNLMSFGMCLLILSLFACTTNPTNSDKSHSVLSPLTDMGAIEVVASGFISTEGPVWHVESGAMIFSDIPGDTVYSLAVNSGVVSKLRSPSDNANGLALYTDGSLLAADQATRSITKMDLQSSEVTPFISSIEYDGAQRAFNSPNDMAVHANGNVYFTDPPFGLRGQPGELGFNGVFVRKTNSEIELIKRLETGQNPNGIIFNADQSILYMAISDDESAPILAYDVDSEGSLSNEREFAQGQNNDGMAIDTQGNLYAANRTGVRVWSSTGEYWGMISLPDDIRTTNVAFGGANMNTLYITNRSADLYAVKLNVTGHQ